MKSKRKLFALLRQLLNQDFSLKHPAISDETFGPKSFVFISCGLLGVSRRVLENKLEDAGFQVNRRYWPESQNVQVRVSYFKGTNWDE